MTVAQLFDSTADTQHQANEKLSTKTTHLMTKR